MAASCMQKYHATGGQSHAKIPCNWRPVAFKLFPSGRQLYGNKNSMRLAACLIQIVAEWPPVACKLPLILFILHATGGHAGTICMLLAAARIQFACDCQPLGYNLNATGGQSHSNCSRVAASCMQKQHATGGQSHSNCGRVAASRMKILFAWPPVAGKLPLILFILHATGSHTGTI